MAQQRPGTSPGGARRGSIGATVGGRYRLDRPLVPELPGAEPWSATDTILDRPVRVDLISGPRTASALDAARRAALVTEPRLARILQVAQDGELGVIVSNQVDGRSLADLAAAGPLVPEQARAIVGEVAAALEEARRRGLHHLALRPGAVVVTPAGRVIVRGLAVDGALIGLADTRAHAASRRDAIDLIRLLYAALTGYWPAPPTSTGAVPTFAEWSGSDAAAPQAEPETGLPDAPTTGTGSTPPAELVPQVPADLDTLCAVTLGPHEDGPHSPGEVVRELEPWRAVHAEELFRAADSGRWPSVGSSTGSTTAAGSTAFAPVKPAGAAGVGGMVSGGAGAAAGSASAVGSTAVAGSTASVADSGEARARETTAQADAAVAEDESPASTPSSGDDAPTPTTPTPLASDDDTGLSWILPAPDDASAATSASAAPTPVWPTMRPDDEPFTAAVTAAESAPALVAPQSAPAPAVADPEPAPESARPAAARPTAAPERTPDPPNSAPASTPATPDLDPAAPDPDPATGDDTQGSASVDPEPAPSDAASPTPPEPGPPTAETPTPASAPPTGSSTMTDQQKPTPDDGTDAESTTPAQGTAPAPGGSPARQSIRASFGSGEGAGARRPGTPPPAIPPRTPGRQASSAAAGTTGAAAAGTAGAAAASAAPASAGPTGTTATGAASGTTAARPVDTSGPAATSAFPATTSGTAPSAGGAGSGGDTPDWGLPFDPESRQPRQPRHQFDPTRWVLGLVGVGIVVALVIAIGNVTRPWGEGGGSNDAAATPSAQATAAPTEAPAAPAEEPAPAAPAVVPTIAGVTTIDPSDGDGEKEELIPRIWDGDPNTAWYTHTYNRPDFAGFKNAVGIAITLAEPATVTSVTLEVNGSGGNVEVRATDAANPTAGDVLTAGPLNGHTVLTLSQPTETQSLVLWFTSLAQTPDGKNRIEISELSVQ